MLGTGKYRTNEEMRAALDASGTEIVTVALRRIDFDDPASRSVLEDIDTSRYAILPNTAGCQTAEEAVRIARMARAMGLGEWVKLEVIPDPVYLLPDPIGTLEAARILVKEGFAVLPYIGADPHWLATLRLSVARRDAARLTYWVRPGHHQPGSDPHHHRPGRACR
jgi:thiazole synthase